METNGETKRLKAQIMEALRHPEADEGLFFRNLFHLHEEDERPGVDGEENEILEALNDLVHEGKVVMDKLDEEVIFRLP